jgi:hypothetical protein
MGALAELKPIDKVLYEPYPHQLAVHNSEAKIKVMVMPVGSGKDICSIEDTIMDMVAKRDIWRERPKEMNPKWHIWLLAPTYKLGEQLWRDACALFPYELRDGDPVEGKMRMPLIDSGLLQVRSEDTPEYLVAEPVDRIVKTEAWLTKRRAWQIEQTRLSRPGRFELSSAILNSTPDDTTDPEDPERDHYLWEMVQEGRDPANWKNIQSWYWFEDKINYYNLEHPILSRTRAGREELNRQRHNPNLSTLEFRRQYKGEAISSQAGKEAVGGLVLGVHVQEPEPIYDADIWRWWDFGRQWPVCIISQFGRKNRLITQGICAPYNQDKLDTEFAEDVKIMTAEIFGSDFDRALIHDAGDFEATHRTDQRRDTTVKELKKMGINLMVKPTEQGDEQNAIQVLNARLRLRQDGTPSWIIHRRCKLLIKALNGKIQHPVRKIGGVEQTNTKKIAEIHPWIDIFDALKEGVKHTPQLKVRDAKYKKSRLVSPTENQQYDETTGRPL